MQSFSRRVDYSSGVKPKKRYTMPLSGQPGEEEGQRVVENQQFRDFWEKLGVFVFMGSDGIHLKVVKKSTSEAVGLFGVCEPPWWAGEVPAASGKADAAPACWKGNEQEQPAQAVHLQLMELLFLQPIYGKRLRWDEGQKNQHGWNRVWATQLPRTEKWVFVWVQHRRGALGDHSHSWAGAALPRVPPWAGGGVWGLPGALCACDLWTAVNQVLDWSKWGAVKTCLYTFL